MNPTAPLSTPPLSPELVRFFDSPQPRDVVVRIDAGGIVDAAGCEFFPGSMLLEIKDGGPLPGRNCWPLCGRGTILAVGAPGAVDDHPAAASALLVSMPGSVVIPGLVNAHTHLDLTHIGPRPFDAAGGFDTWIDMVRVNRAASEVAIAASVRTGIELCLAGGTVAVGDIGGANGGGPNLTPWRVLRDSPLLGTSYLEFFAIGAREAAGLSRMADVVHSARVSVKDFEDNRSRVRFGLQPHAPNTVSLLAYLNTVKFAHEQGLPLCTHLAESPQEHELVARGSGSFRALLERLTLWDDAYCADFGLGLTPIKHLEPAFSASKFLLAHVNDASDADLDILTRTGQAVVYCPRASAYFGNDRHFGSHRYREMRARGIPVALGTDSIINLPADRCGQSASGQSTGGLGVLDEMRALYLRDGVDAYALLRMATLSGAEVLGLNSDEFRFRLSGQPAGVVAISADDPASLRGVMTSDSHPRLLFIRN